MTLRRSRHVFLAVVDYFDRMAGFPSQQCRVSRDHRRILFFPAECAACLLLYDADLVRRQIKQRHQRFLNVVRALHRSTHGHALLPVEGSDHAIRFDIELLLRARGIFALKDVCRLRPNSIHVAFLHQVVLDHFIRTQSFVNIVDRRERFVVNLDKRTGFLKQVFVGMSQQQNRLMHMIDRFRSQIWLIFDNEGNYVLARNVFGRDNREFAPRHAVLKSNFAYMAARDRAAHGNAVPHTRQMQIVNVVSFTRHFASHFFSEHGRPNHVVAHISCPLGGAGKRPSS